MPVCT